MFFRSYQLEKTDSSESASKLKPLFYVIKRIFFGVTLVWRLCDVNVMLTSIKPPPVETQVPSNCPTTWPSPSASLSASLSSTSGPLASGPFFDQPEFPDMNRSIATTSVTSPIAVTGPALAHAPYGPQPHLPVPASGPAGAAAYSLPPQLYWSHPHQGPPVGNSSNNCGFQSTPVMFGEKKIEP